MQTLLKVGRCLWSNPAAITTTNFDCEREVFELQQSSTMETGLSYGLIVTYDGSPDWTADIFKDIEKMSSST